MPNIKEYRPSQEVSGVVQGPRASADAFGGSLGRGMEQFGHGISQAADVVQKNVERSEISDVNAKLAKAQADWTVEWNETLKTADPGDKTFASRFNEGLQEKLEAVREGITTRAAEQHFEQGSARLQAHFTETTYQGQSTLAGIKSKEDYISARGYREATLVNDPSSFQKILQDEDSDVESRIATGLDRRVAESLRGDAKIRYAKAALNGWSKLNPEYSKELINSGKFDQYLDGDAKIQMLGHADQEISARFTKETRMRAEQERIKKDQQEEFQTSIYTDIVRGNTNDIENRILDNPVMEFAQKKQMIDIVRRNATEKIRTEPAVFLNLLNRIHAPDDDKKKLNDEAELIQYVGNGITVENLNFLRGEMQGKKTTAGKIESDLKANFLKAAEAKLVKKDALGTVDPVGQQNYTNYIADFYQKFEAAKKAGKDPYDLLGNPKSPDYMGDMVNQYYKTPQQKMKATVNLMRPVPAVTPTPVPKYNPGEDLDEYFSRAKGKPKKAEK